MTVVLSIEKIFEVEQRISKIEKVGQYKIMDFAAFIGTLESCSTLKYGRIHMKLFEKEKILALKRNNDD